MVAYCMRGPNLQSVADKEDLRDAGKSTQVSSYDSMLRKIYTRILLTGAVEAHPPAKGQVMHRVRFRMGARAVVGRHSVA